MLKRVIAVVALLALPLMASAEDFVAGKDYQVISNPGGTESKPGQIEVREFFWYGCPHCFRLDPFLGKWLSAKPADVNFVRTPAALNSTWEIAARGYYVAESLGVAEKAHSSLFQAVHVSGQQAIIASPDGLARFYTGYGVDTKNFNSLYNSFMVGGKIARSKALAMQYHLEGVPALVVAGKYVVQGENQRTVDVMNYLVAKERASEPKKK